MIFFRRLGYHFEREAGGERSFAKRLSRGDYPKFHIYTKEENGQCVLTLHIDHKKPSYGGGSHAHSGEYDGALVEQEIEYIRTNLKLKNQNEK